MTIATPGISGDFRIGSVINRAWDVFSANFPFFFGITFILALPNVFFLTLTDEPQSPTRAVSAVVAVFVAMVLNVIGEAVILYAAFQYLRGRPAPAGEALNRGLARFLPLIGVGILYTLGGMAGLLLFVVPGVMLLVRWAIAVPACVVEGLGPSASLGRSADLTKGYRWKIFGLMLLVGVVNMIGGGIVGAVLPAMGYYVGVIGNLIWTAIWAAYWNCMLVMLYHDLRVAKEGLDTEQIASVFD